MKILIIEDEIPIATYIKNKVISILENPKLNITICHSLIEADNLTNSRSIDLCLLDLNLNGKDGFEILKKATAHAFSTIIISANVDRAIEAFEYGVLDFIPKPFETERLKSALDRFFNTNYRRGNQLKYISFRKKDGYHVLEIENIKYFKASNIYIEAHLYNGSYELLDKTMESMDRLLPSYFIRIHRSYIVRISEIISYKHSGGGIYQVTLKDGSMLPLSRAKYRLLQQILDDYRT